MNFSGYLSVPRVDISLQGGMQFAAAFGPSRGPSGFGSRAGRFSSLAHERVWRYAQSPYTSAHVNGLNGLATCATP
jgi:hypothetical protein